MRQNEKRRRGEKRSKRRHEDYSISVVACRRTAGPKGLGPFHSHPWRRRSLAWRRATQGWLLSRTAHGERCVATTQVVHVRRECRAVTKRPYPRRVLAARNSAHRIGGSYVEFSRNLLLEFIHPSRKTKTGLRTMHSQGWRRNLPRCESPIAPHASAGACTSLQRGPHHRTVSKYPGGVPCSY